MLEELTEDRAAEIRDQERRKLQGVIDKLSRDKEALQDSLKSLESRSEKGLSTDAEESALTKTLSRLEKMLGKEDNKDMPELKEIKEMLAAMSAPKKSSDLEPLKSQIAELSKVIKEEKERNQKMAEDITLKQQRLMISEAIRNIGKPVIEELVGGETEEEIIESVKRAASRYEDIVKNAISKRPPATADTEEQEAAPADKNTEPSTQSTAGDTETLGSPEAKNLAPQPHATGSGPTPTSGPSQMELIEKLSSLPPKERIKFFNEHREVLERVAAGQYTSSTV